MKFPLMCNSTSIHVSFQLTLQVLTLLFGDDSEENNSLQHRQNKNRYIRKLLKKVRQQKVQPQPVLSSQPALGLGSQGTKNFSHLLDCASGQ